MPRSREDDPSLRKLGERMDEIIASLGRLGNDQGYDRTSWPIADGATEIRIIREENGIYKLYITPLGNSDAPDITGMRAYHFNPYNLNSLIVKDDPSLRFHSLAGDQKPARRAIEAILSTAPVADTIFTVEGEI